MAYPSGPDKPPEKLKVYSNMKVRLLVPGLIALLLFISACVPPLNLRNDKYLKDDSLISKEPCDAPCWRGITPGETQWSEALTIVEDSADLDDPQVQNAQEGSGIGAVWQPKDGETCCQMATLDGETVSVIVLRLAPTLKLGDLIEARGEPNYVLGSPGDEEQAIINLFYPDNFLIVTVFVAGDKKGELSASSEIVGAFYVAPDQMDLILKTNYLYGWKGYQPFSAYAPKATSDAPEATEPDFVITPSVTETATATP